MHVASWFHWNPQNHVALCISPLILSLLPRAWDGRRSHQRKGNIFLEISISGPATSSHPILMAFQITEHHMSIRKPWSSQLSDASRDVTMKNGVPSSLFPTKATQSFWKTSQMRSFPMTQRMSLHRSPNPPRRFLMKFVMSSHQEFKVYLCLWSNTFVIFIRLKIFKFLPSCAKLYTHVNKLLRLSHLPLGELKNCVLHIWLNFHSEILNNAEEAKIPSILFQPQPLSCH